MHVSYLTKKHPPTDTDSESIDKEPSFDAISPEMRSTLIDSTDGSNIIADLSKSRMSDSRLTQSDFGPDKVALKT